VCFLLDVKASSPGPFCWPKAGQFIIIVFGGRPPKQALFAV
jgi:hypothetical protein